jgi:hypothetical protein
LSPGDFATFGAPSEYLRRHAAPDDRLVVYPYENLFGRLSERTVTTGMLQNYAVGGQYFTGLQLAALERERPRLGVYCTDNIVSWPVDGISNFQRTAQVWFYLQSHYVVDAEPSPGVTILRRDEARASGSVHIGKTLWQGPQRSGSAALNVSIDSNRWNGAQPDFLRLQMRVQYPIWWKLTKPSAITATLRFADGSAKTARLSVEPDVQTEVWIYPWDEAVLKDYFQAEALLWRRPGASRPALVRIELKSARFDRLSATPSYMEVNAVDGIVLAMKATLTK